MCVLRYKSRQNFCSIFFRVKKVQFEWFFNFWCTFEIGAKCQNRGTKDLLILGTCSGALKSDLTGSNYDLINFQPRSSLEVRFL